LPAPEAAQLPPIGFGLVFHRLAALDEMPRTELVTLHHQAAATGIPQVAVPIRSHTLPVLPAFAGRLPGVSMAACSPSDVVATLFHLTDAWAGEEWQIIAGTNAEIERINREFFFRDLTRPALVCHNFAVGDPVVIVQYLKVSHGDRYADAVEFAVLTTMRRGEVYRIAWPDVDEKKRLVMDPRPEASAKKGWRRRMGVTARRGLGAAEAAVEKGGG
jgi:hypothetical protein